MNLQVQELKLPAIKTLEIRIWRPWVRNRAKGPGQAPGTFRMGLGFRAESGFKKRASGIMWHEYVSTQASAFDDRNPKFLRGDEEKRERHPCLEAAGDFP